MLDADKPRRCAAWDILSMIATNCCGRFGEQAYYCVTERVRQGLSLCVSITAKGAQMVTAYFVEYDGEDGDRVWWHQSVNEAVCEILMDLLEEEGRNPKTFSFDVDPAALTLRGVPA